MNDLDMGRAAYVVACQQRRHQYIVPALKTLVLRRRGVFRSVSSLSSLRTRPGSRGLRVGGLGHQ